MHDIKTLRRDPAAFDRSLVKRGYEPASEKLLAMDKARRGNQTVIQELQRRANEAARVIGSLKVAGQDATKAIEESARLKALLNEAKAQQDKVDDESEPSGALYEALISLPNVLHESVPPGADESANVAVKTWGEPRVFTFKPRAHWELGERLGMLDFTQTSGFAGSRFSTLIGPLARLERALAQFMLDLHTEEHGYVEAAPPFLVKDSALFGTGQLPKFSEECFATTDGRRLIPTSEVPLTNLAAERIWEASMLPLRFTADTPCFRSEAGAAGRDTRGLMRQHQFRKVELVSVTTPQDSYQEHERLTRCAETVLERLGLPYRRMLLCAGDTGFSAAKTYDLEAWLPFEGKYREISSCSNCEGFQARRMRARVRLTGGVIQDLHTLNGSGVATGRCLIAVMENYQNEDGSITVPDVLIPYMKIDKISV